MKTRISFTADETETDELQKHINGPTYALIIRAALYSIRNQLKYTEHSNQTVEALEQIRQDILNELESYGVSLD